MKRRLISTVLAVSLVGVLSAGLTPEVDAQTKKAAAAKGGKKAGKGKGKGKAGAEEATAGDEAAGEGAEGEGRVVGADAGAAKKGGGPTVVDVKSEGDGGVKTYKFGPVEVEGRLKSPQVVYFMRRVRAEFAAGQLGHRSFMRELSDTRRHPALK